MRSTTQQSGSLFDAISERLSGLIHRFGVEHERERILKAYDLLCRESLMQEAASRPIGFSRINADGTPIQFSLSFASSRPSPLQFLAEVGAPGSTIEERISISRNRILQLAGLLGAGSELVAIDTLRDMLAPAGDPSLHRERSGVYWVGVSFRPVGPPALTIYINSKWGDEEARWNRFRAFAKWFGGAESWLRIEEKLRPAMTPLGTAITLSKGSPLSGRLYASAYGLPLHYYGSLLGDFCLGFAEALLGEDCAYPLRSTVCSYELDMARGSVGAKFELCAHCAFSSDAEVSAKVGDWLKISEQDAALYADTLQILTRGSGLSNTKPPEVHAYLGTGVRGREAYSSVYLNPGPPMRGD